MLWWRCDAQTQAAGETERGQEAHEDGGQCRNPPGSLHGRPHAGGIAKSGKGRATSSPATCALMAGLLVALSKVTTKARQSRLPGPCVSFSAQLPCHVNRELLHRQGK